MAKDVNLKWEWPADREPALKYVVKVSSITKADGGWFGLKRSPSIVEGVPKPVNLSGHIIHGDQMTSGQSVTLTLPELELVNISQGDIVALGMVKKDTCICLKKMSAPDEDLSDWHCSSD